jgi:hypothetical protein
VVWPQLPRIDEVKVKVQTTPQSQLKVFFPHNLTVQKKYRVIKKSAISSFDLLKSTSLCTVVLLVASFKKNF